MDWLSGVYEHVPRTLKFPEFFPLCGTDQALRLGLIKQLADWRGAL
jgi:hypothetical protein